MKWNNDDETGEKPDLTKRKYDTENEQALQACAKIETYGTKEQALRR